MKTVIDLYRREDGSEVLITDYHDEENGTVSREVAVRDNGYAVFSPPLRFIRREGSLPKRPATAELELVTQERDMAFLRLAELGEEA